MSDFQRKVLIVVLDWQIFNVLYLFLIYLPGRVFVAYDFFKDYGSAILFITYFSYFLFFDFKLRRTIAMRIFKYHIIVPTKTSTQKMLKYELLGILDLCVFPVYFVISILSVRNNRKLLREKYTGVSMEKLE